MQINRVLESSGQNEWRKKIIWMDEYGQEEKLWKALNLTDMTGSTSAVILRKCESMHEKHLKGVYDNFWKDISPILSGFRPSIWPFFCFESEWKYNKPVVPAKVSGKKYFLFAREKGWMWEYPGLNKGDVAKYIIKKCRMIGIEPGPGVMQDLISLLPLDSHSIDLELDKLSLLIHPEKTILKEHLEAVVSRSEIDIFAFLQAVQNGKNAAPIWNKIFSEQLKGQAMIFPFIGLLLREARILWQLATGQDKMVKLQPWLIKQKKTLAANMGPAKISLLWDLALEAESGVKSGQIDKNQAMDALTAKLFKTFSC